MYSEDQGTFGSYLIAKFKHSIARVILGGDSRSSFLHAPLIKSENVNHVLEI